MKYCSFLFTSVKVFILVNKKVTAIFQLQSLVPLRDKKYQSIIKDYLILCLFIFSSKMPISILAILDAVASFKIFGSTLERLFNSTNLLEHVLLRTPLPLE